ncbi:MAG TPA: metalloregulator ArsR/SmtB family transcription factor [Anaerolineae bacterium]|nr:metalloregulator ArsR/SmtB family transcription factor [Anaerolineae bacterium]
MDPYRVQAELIKAMAHPARLQILEILAHEECCVCHLTTVLRKRQAYVSQQLMILRDAKLVVDRREGVVVYYRLADPLVAEAITLTRQLRVATGRELEFPSVPESPVDGCPCAKCSDGLWSS